MLVEQINRMKNLMLMEAKMVTFNQPNGNFVILAGGPGAGKSYVSQHFIDLDNVKPFNVDNYRIATAKKLWGDNWEEMISTDEGYKTILDLTHTTSDPRNVTIQFLKNFLESERKEPTNIVYDAGGGQEKVMRDIIRLAEENGFVVSIVHVVTELEKALERNLERDRSLPPEMVVDYHDKVKNAVGNLVPMVDNYWVVDNTQDLDRGERPLGRIHQLK
jgi:predicted kinase